MKASPTEKVLSMKSWAQFEEMNISEVTVFDSEDQLSENVTANYLFGVEIAMGKW